MNTRFYTTYINDCEISIEYEQDPYIPANLSGPPDTWHPAEGGAVYILNITYKDEDGTWQTYRATPEQMEMWTQEIECLPIEPEGPDPDEWYDRMRDERMFEKRAASRMG